MSIGVIIGTAASVYWLQRYVRATRAYWRGQKRADELESTLRRAREELSSPIPLRVATGADVDLVASLRRARAGEDELVARGFRVLGDIVAEGAAAWIMRALVDRDGTTSAVLMVPAKPSGAVLLRFSSYLGDEVFLTGRATGPSLADPPFVHRQTLPHAPVSSVLAQHRAFARLDDKERSFFRSDSLEDMLARAEKTRSDAARWRDAQPPEVLLDADLRSVLGTHYGVVGASMARRLRAQLPTATLRR